MALGHLPQPLLFFLIDHCLLEPSTILYLLDDLQSDLLGHLWATITHRDLDVTSMWVRQLHLALGPVNGIA